jgi:hypothetical protein
VTDAIAPALDALADALASCDWDKAAISAAFKQVLAAQGLKMPQLAMPVRVLTAGNRPYAIGRCSAGTGGDVKKLSRVCETAKNLSIIQGSDDNDCNVNVVEVKGGYSSAGRALAWHARGHRFDPVYLHQGLSVVIG